VNLIDFLSGLVQDRDELVNYQPPVNRTSLLGNRTQTPASVQFVQDYGDFLPVVGDITGAAEVGQELSKDDPNYPLAAALGLATVVGAVPVVGDTVARGIVSGAKGIADAVPSDVKYATRSLLEGEPRGVLEAFQSGRTPQSVGAEAVNVDGQPFGATEAERRLMEQRIAQMEDMKNRSQVRMYSPSLRAAKRLPQEKGTYEQLRKWMIDKGGAKQDELTWAGADREFSGKKITKQELIDYLADNTEMVRTENLRSYGGVTGDGEAMSAEDMVNEYVEMALDNEIEFYKTDYGYDVINDEGYLTLDDLDNDQLFEAAEELGYESADDFVSDAYRGWTRVKRRDDGGWEAFEDDEAAVLDHFGGEDEIRRMAEDSLRDNAEYEASRHPEGFWTDYLGRDIDDYYSQQFDEGDTEYSKWFTEGGEDYTERLFRYQDRTGLLNEGILPSASHFDGDQLLGWTRTAKFPLSSEDGKAFLIGEVQSDVGQNLRKSNSDVRTFDEMVAESEWRKRTNAANNEYNRTIFDLARQYVDLDDNVKNRIESELNLRQFVEQVKLREDQDLGTSIRNWSPERRQEFIQYQRGEHPEYKNPYRVPKNSASAASMAELLNQLDVYNYDVPEMRGMIETQKVAEEARKAVFQDAEKLSDIADRRNIGYTGILENTLPYVDTTPKWVDMMLRQNIATAIKEGEDIVALPNPNMVRDMTMGTPEGQGEFYGNIAPRRLQNVAQKIDKTAKVEPMQIETAKGFEDVFGLRLTPDFIRNAAEKGIPTWMVAGGVGLGGIMDYLQQQKEQRNERYGGLFGYGG
jgi:hypothetical protein